jgi:DNA polymerase V
MPSLFALVDCNNFYASCERVFNPVLQNKPVVVLSNNDGCIIARSNEAKAVGIGMGAPFFKVKNLISHHRVVVYSSNYSLYGDMSQRVMETLSQFTPELEIYSIDEAFLNLSGFEAHGLVEYGRKIKKTIKQWTGIPVSIGIAPTKTLAKVANYFAKNHPSYEGVCELKDAQQQIEALKVMPIEKLWGIGPSYARLMKHNGIKTAFDFTNTPQGWIKKHMGVVGLRMVQELQGISCLHLEICPPPKKGICSSRSFGAPVESMAELEEAVSTYVARAAEKLRSENLSAKILTVFIETSPFKENYYSNSYSFTLPVASSFTPELIRYALEGLQKIYCEGYRYKRAGIFFQGLVLNHQVQQGLFDPVDRVRGAKLMKTMDGLNRQNGEGTIRIASQGYDSSWKLKFKLRSPRFTTHWDELLEVKA